ncbi:MAG: gluconate 2-dehydrogenase subunit 3 family protein [Colwellia sp.]|nr:gluconate 2-dehydrogenase subunit 3 family protein [Colwellia sp.]MCW8866280.1 gluconate 2-dehydrogenase subunit 3 family protein [Colwellia sp.]MCW9081494.1 gluconate 2-dehydrogenase subunit 3 family protein [Colwellia sp.]
MRNKQTSTHEQTIGMGRQEKSRRRFLKNVTTMFGGAAIGSILSGNAISVAMAYVPSADSTLTDGKVFNSAQLRLLKQICAIVIPKTDTLGAAEVDTHGFIDNQLFHCHSKVEQEQTIELLSLINQIAEQSLSAIFLKLNAEQQFQLLTELDLGEKRFVQTQRKAFKKLKQLICFGYYTSEVGATQELRYDPVPGGFKGSIPYKSSDPTWATRGLFD